MNLQSYRAPFVLLEVFKLCKLCNTLGAYEWVAGLPSGERARFRRPLHSLIPFT